MKLIYRRCCGIDVHKKSVSVCVLPPEGEQGAVKRETFRTFFRDLKRLRAWLKSCKVTEVAMESTGQYWRPLWNVLEGHVDHLVLLNPAHVKGLAGRKTDRRDAEWLARMNEREHLRGSFVAPAELREMRELTRTRVHLLEDCNRMKNRIAQILESGNIKISSVASDLFGLSGRRMLDALIEGKHKPAWMADYACTSLRKKRDQLEMALEGTLTDHQRRLLRRLVRQLQSLETEIVDLTAEIELRAAPWEEMIGRLIEIPGIDRVSAWTILAEIGTDMSVFPDSKHLASWAAVCPGNRESGGKRMSGKTRKGNCYLRRSLCQSAWAATRKKGSYPGTIYRRVRGRRGHQKAIMALAHRMLTIIFHMLRDDQPYRELGTAYNDEKRKAKNTARMVRGLEGMGFRVTLEVLPTPEELREFGSPTAAPETGPSVPRRGRPCKCAERGMVCKHQISPPPPSPPEITEIYSR
jgi:transposase